ncbi:MAG TPA: hypothetical protein VEW46_24210 [Pyrinomonadaceae bacterium]|nr:hypothetical protein [Pyrinomonadaceae bacterium]
MSLDKLVVEAQSVLNDLWVESLIPFELTAHKVECIAPGEYIIRFHDSRLRSVDVSWKETESFNAAVREAMLSRAARLSGPLIRTARKPASH